MRNSSSLDWLRFMHTPNDYRVSPYKSFEVSINLTIQEKREDLFCYSSKSSIAKRLVGMNMKKQYSRYDVMYRYNIGCIRYIYKTE